MKLHFFVILLILISNLYASKLPQDKLKKVNQQAKAKEAQIERQPEHVKKVNGFLVDQINYIQKAMNAEGTSNPKQISSKFAEKNIPMNQEGALKVKIILSKDINVAQFDEYQQWFCSASQPFGILGWI